MRNIGSKKRFALVASTVAAVLIGSGVAVAFWTTSGTGTGSASTADSSALDITQTNTIDNLYPGGPAQDIDIEIDNSSTNPQSIDDVDVSIASVSPVGCAASNFTVTDGVIAGSPNNIDPGANPFAGSVTGASIVLNETGVNQDICKNATVSLEFDAS